MNTFLLLILILVFSFISFHFINQKLQKRFLYLTGLEFLFIGILMNEHLINFVNQTFQLHFPILLSKESSIQLKPVIATILGAVGFSVGLQFRIKNFFGLSIEHFKLSITDIVFTFLLMSLLSYLILTQFFSQILNINEILINSLIIGITAVTFSGEVLNSIRSKFSVSGSNFNALVSVSQLNNFFAIVIVGTVFAVFRKGSTLNFEISPTEWFVISSVLGLLIGFLFFVFLERETNETKLLLALLGIIIFSSGSAYFLNLSPIFLNLMVGFVIGNFFKEKESLLEIFKKLDHPFYVIILIYAGSLLFIDNMVIFISGILIYVLARYCIKYFTGWFAYHSSFDKNIFSPMIGKGLNTQGVIAITIMVSFYQVYSNPLIHQVYAIVIFSVLINETLSTRILKNLLIDLNEIT